MITEQHLYLALEAYSKSPEHSKLSELAKQSIINYVYNEFVEKEEKDWDEADIIKRSMDLLAGHMVNNAVANGLIDVEFDGDTETLGLTAKGEELAKIIN